jgi:hypothetical protein
VLQQLEKRLQLVQFFLSPLKLEAEDHMAGQLSSNATVETM